MSEINEVAENTTDSKKLITLGVMRAYEAAKQAEKEALEAAIKKASDDAGAALGSTKTELEGKIATASEALSGEIAGLSETLTQTVEGLKDTGIKLSKDLYTYADIGVITGASEATPVQVGTAGESIREMFINIFGEQKDADPTVVTNEVALQATAGTTSYSGGEYGASIAAVNDLEITFTLKNKASTNFGYCYDQAKEGDTGEVETIRVTGNVDFYYPVETVTCPNAVDTNGNKKTAQLKITLPEGKTADVDSTYLVDSETVENITTLYCNFNSSKQVKIKIDLPASTSGASEITRYGKINAAVTLGAAQKENQLTAGTAIKVLSFFGDTPQAGDIANSISKTKSAAAGPYKITSGTKYTYWATTTTAETPSAWVQYDTNTANTAANPTTSTTDLQLSCNAKEYIWVASTSNYASFYAWNDASGKYNADKLPTTKTGPTTITNAQGATPDKYYIYRTTDAMLQAVNTKFKLGN